MSKGKGNSDRRRKHSTLQQDEMLKQHFNFFEADWAVMIYTMFETATIKAGAGTGVMFTKANTRKMCLDFARTVNRAHLLWLKKSGGPLNNDLFGAYCIEMIDWKEKAWPNAARMADAIQMRVAMEMPNP